MKFLLNLQFLIFFYLNLKKPDFDIEQGHRFYRVSPIL